MRTRERYLIADSIRQVTQLLKISPERVLRRAGLPEDHLAAETRGVSARDWFALWEAVAAEYGREDIALRLGQAFARGPFVPPIFAFSCSPNIELGLARLALFKPLMGPIHLDVQRQEDALVVTYTSVDPTVAMPAACARFEAAYFVECCRIFTGEQIVPLEVGMIGEPHDWAPLVPMLGVTPTPSDHFHLTFSLHDATLPLITRNEEMWAGFEDKLRKKMLNRNASVEMTERVRNALLEALPSGHNTIDDICKRLHLSKRTLQRKLKEEGRTFQNVLDETRSDLSLHYLKQRDLSVVEISYLLGFRDPGSFYRAFQSWTGQTPADMRKQLSN
ncbi:AraC family transcriptional regulator [Tropicimonas sediminicola]|uniref:AraC-type DNA-binding protein n=1 Tax=Tropicimonas sediminicola TaxID=1031541 RepID=A0A239LJB7_9RHOB|nr:AraC family transcriptional regulator [Tropicimonas sediminicola]SNT30686.1 AraC-type DNA-binding protein [Tropicimonas sediminicola]